MLSVVINSAKQLPDSFSVETLQEMAMPRAVLMCPPNYFDVLDVKNPFMERNIHNVDLRRAATQWADLKNALEERGINVELIEPLEGCEDMVFCANPVFTGLNNDGSSFCVLAHMKYESRRRELPAFASWFDASGYRILNLGSPTTSYEGGGDTIWHPRRRLIWGGYGQRTGKEIYGPLAELLATPVITLELSTEMFYHLDTCFCPVNSSTVLIYPGGLTDAGIELVRRVFPCVIEVNEHEAIDLLACNAASFLERYVFIQKGAENVIKQLRGLGFEVIEVETGEFLKSGGSVFCMKTTLF